MFTGAISVLTDPALPTLTGSLSGTLLVVVLVATEIGTQSGNPLFWLGVILWVGPFLGAGARWLRLRARYIELYRAKADSNLLADETLAECCSREPERWLVGVLRLAWRLSRLGSAPHPQPELEAARRRANRWERLTYLLMFGGVFWPIALFVLTR